MYQKFKALNALTGSLTEFDLSDIPAHPQALFASWFRQAVDQGVVEPQVMTLATADKDGCPDARSVVLLNVDELGWHFATSTASPKGRQMAQQPNAALNFYWAGAGRQIRLRGPVSRIDSRVAAVDFAARPERSRAMILAARQSDLLEHVEDVESVLNEQISRLKEIPDLISAHWAIFAVRPAQVEFWQSNRERRFTRLRYRRTDDGWITEWLWP